MSEFYIKNRFKMLSEMIKSHRIVQSGFDHNTTFSLGPHNKQEVSGKLWPHSQIIDYGYSCLKKIAKRGKLLGE